MLFRNNKKGAALAILAAVLFGIIVVVTLVPELKQTILDIINAF